MKKWSFPVICKHDISAQVETLSMKVCSPFFFLYSTLKSQSLFGMYMCDQG